MNRAIDHQHAMWTETFTRLQHAATNGVPAEEIHRLEAAELAELDDAEAAHGGGR